MVRRRGVAAERAWLASSARDAMLTAANDLSPLETGGMLLGYTVEREGVPEAVIDQIIGPGPAALHGRTRFVPDGRWQRYELAAVFADSCGTTTYLGDWHSHPGGSSAPSALDLKTARAISTTRRARTVHPLMTIVHQGEGGSWALAVYRYAGRTLGMIPLRDFEDVRVTR